MMTMTNFQALTYTIFFPVAMLLIGFLMGRLSRPKLYHGHIEPVQEKPKQKEPEPKKLDKIQAVHKAFGRKRQ